MSSDDDVYNQEEEEERFHEDEQLRMLREIMNEHRRKLIQGADIDSEPDNSDQEGQQFYEDDEEMLVVRAEDVNEDECQEVKASSIGILRSGGYEQEENKENNFTMNAKVSAAPTQQESILQIKRELFERSKQLKTAITGIQVMHREQKPNASL